MGWTGRISGTLARLKRQKSKEGLNASYTGGVRALCKESVKTWRGQKRENPVNRLTMCARLSEAVTWERNNRAMTFNAAREWQFSSEQGKANYEAAQKQYPAQAIVDMAALRNNMRHLVSVVGGPNSGTAVMGVVKADAYGHGLIPAALAALAGRLMLTAAALTVARKTRG